MHMLRRSVLLVVVAASAAFCASTPTESTPPTTTTTTVATQSPSANVHATGTVTFSNCSDGKCAFQGAVTNDGPDCASNVRGVTHVFDASGKEIESQSWEILGRVRRGDTTFNGCCFSQSAVSGSKSIRTDVSFEPLLCI